MLTLLEIETAADALPLEGKRELFVHLAPQLGVTLDDRVWDASSDIPGSQGHSVLDIPTVSLGGVLCPQTPEDDLLGEMLEGRK